MPRVISSLPIGSKVVDPHSMFYGKPIVWKMIAVNHPGYPADSVTLLSDRVLSLRAFDAREPNNTEPTVGQGGSNRYSESNIRQWLNGWGTSWYNEAHQYDEAPASSYVENAQNSYVFQPGFLSLISNSLTSALKDTQLTTARNTVTAGGGSEKVTDKVFLLSKTEMGLVSEGGVDEGVPFDIFTSAPQRSSRPTGEAIVNSEYFVETLSSLSPWMYWLRTPIVNTADSLYANGMSGVGLPAFSSHVGVRPAINIGKEVYVEDEPNEFGEYQLAFSASDLLKMKLDSDFPNFTCTVDNTSRTVLFQVKLNGAIIESVANPTFPQKFEVGMEKLSEGRNTLEVYTLDERALNNSLTTYLHKKYKALPETQLHKSLGKGNTTDEVRLKLVRESTESAGSIHRILGGIG